MIRWYRNRTESIVDAQSLLDAGRRPLIWKPAGQIDCVRGLTAEVEAHPIVQRFIAMQLVHYDAVYSADRNGGLPVPSQAPTPVEPVVEAPAEPVVEAPVEVPVEAPAEAPAEAVVEPVVEPVEAPAAVEEAAPVAALEETPAETEPATVEAPEELPSETPSETPETVIKSKPAKKR